MATGGPSQAAPAAPAQPVQEAGYQTMVEAESVDEFVHSQTTRLPEKYSVDLSEMNDEDKKINRFIRNTEKNRFTNISCFDEVLDPQDKDFFVHANTFRSPFGSFIISQAPNKITIGDHLHLMWIYNVRTVVCLVAPEEAGGYFDVKEGGKVVVFMKYTMKTMAVFDEKQGITVYQCELRSHKAPEPQSRRIVYIICSDTPVSGIRPPRVQSAVMEYMWSFEQAEALDEGPTDLPVLVHGTSGTRRCASFVVAAVMCRQILETGQFSAMESWIEMRKRRAHTCTRKHDFYSSLHTVFAFSAQCCTVSETDTTFVKSMEVMKTLLEKRQAPNRDAEPQQSEGEGKSEV